ncbi:methyltransferase-like protein 27 [Pocillopora verrucosa]|uniref:methyltransferase-like protein 27 n=1 Tax=Pocillopora verrucosa TaxID=203993 RepID=UPI00333E326C
MDKKQLKASLTKYFGETTAKITKETTEDEIKRIYAARSATYDEEHSAARTSYFKPLAESLHNALKEVYQDKPMDQIKIIDAGAGTGLIGVELKKLGYTNLCALDISAEMLTEAKKKEIYTEFICTSLNGQSIPQIKSGQFDALICGGALITGRIGSSAFVEMIRMVQTDGVLCFNIMKEELEHYQEMMTELEKAGEWMCMCKESSAFYAAEDLPSECWEFVYKVLKN